MPDPMPRGYHTVTPYLVVSDAAKLIDFLKRAFGATERYKMAGPDGSVGHAEMQIGDSVVMLGQQSSQARATRSMIYLYVPDCDALYRSALAAGATSIREPSDQFYGDRNGAVSDFAGNEWWVATHKEDVSSAEMERRMAAARANA